MTTSSGAFSDADIDWDSIQWDKVYQNVRRLQARMVQAIQAQRWGKVKALQRLLTRSFSAKALAVRRVTENTGKKTPGVDGILWETPAKKAQALAALQPRGYQPAPLKRVSIPKANGQERPLSIPTMRDRAMQTLYVQALDPIAECQADPNSYGFRRERSPADAIGQCHNLLSRRGGPTWILEGDIRACFDTISHPWLEAHIPMEKLILRKWLKAGFIEQDILQPTESGTPQGGPASPVLANFTLDGLEQKLREKYPQATALSRCVKVNLVRYCDDFIITGCSKELLEQEVKPLVEEFLQTRGLELAPAKTRITHIADGFDFLGQQIRRAQDGKIIITPSKASVAAILTKIRDCIKRNAQAAAGHLIVQLNPLIQGWTNYHQHVVSKQTFGKLDQAIFQALWRWAQRRHPHKPQRWIKEKYFTTVGGDHWVFTGTVMGQDGATQTVTLRKAAHVPIKRHVKIKGAANPYDPAWEAYFEHRVDAKMKATLQGRQQLLALYREQEGICPICRQEITEQSEWQRHHLIWRSKGGKDTLDNLVLLHPECHRQVHRLKLEVRKPRSVKGVGVARAD
ncbi:MAG: group II intron reverse transcriptase/maturase [Acidobacteria bacterium]|nr:group II intron reverse transcriptase/maturase [Acidobacteriota bacterium]